MTRSLIRVLCSTLFLAFVAALPAVAQDAAPAAEPAEDPRAATGGAMTREDIMARQRGEEVPSRQRMFGDGGAADQAGALGAQLGIRGAASDSEIWEALRFNELDDISVSAGGDVAKVLVQDRGIWWYEFRAGPLKQYGGYLLLGMIGLLAVFYLIRGKIRIEHGRAGVTIQRFNAVERFGHWLLAGSFIVLAITGLVVLFGRIAIIPILGHEAFATIATVSKWVHNNVSWAFMLGIVLVFFFWVIHNLPSRTDIVWLAKAGGLFTKGVHPPAKKFNAGQKFIFWSVILLGGSISASGLSMLFPFELPMFAKTFAVLNDVGVPGWLGMEPFPTVLAPHEEMQFATLWHTIVSFILIAIVIAHIYIGSVGMEGAYDAMGSGQVDLNWAKEHHSLWVEDVQAKSGAAKGGAATPAE